MPPLSPIFPHCRPSLSFSLYTPFSLSSLSSPATMNRRIKHQSAAVKPENRYFRYLKPGALAQLRDSKIFNARSHLRSRESQISLHRAIATPSSPSSAFTAGVVFQQQPEVAGTLTTTDGALPFISGRLYAPRCLHRKKLMAARSMRPDPVIGVIGIDSIVGH